MIPPSPDGRYSAYRSSTLAVRNVFDDSGNIPAYGVCLEWVDIDDTGLVLLWHQSVGESIPSALTAALGKA
jgi:hypothetical protein